MATNDVRIHDKGGLNVTPTRVYQTEAAATDILPGEPVKLKAAGSPYVIPLATGEPVIGTTTQVIGIAKSASTHTATADGEIEVYVPQPGVVYACKATTPANVDTQAEIDALANDRITFDLANGVYTIDENEGDDAPHGLQLLGGNPETGEMYFTIRPAAAEGPIA